MKSLPWMVALLLTVLALADSPARAQSNDALRQGLALQIALERAGFSAGIADGKPGGKAALAIRFFQESKGLPATGQTDAATLAALQVDPEKALTSYTVAEGDLSQVGPAPRKWKDKAKARRLPYASLDEMLAEKFHTTRTLLATLNPGVRLGGLKPGDTIVAPNVPAMPRWTGVERIQIDLSGKTLRLLGADGKTRGLLHCSVAAKKENLPHGKTSVAVISHEPTYKFDPRKWPEVRGIAATLLIPPGPRNPVGLCWIGLGLRGYGIHGSPSPENIGKTGSHGCIRLTNWDAIRLGRSISVGTPVAFTRGASPTAVASR